MKPTSAMLAERMEAALQKREALRTDTERLMARHRTLVQTRRDLVADATWFLTMAQRDMGIPADLNEFA